MVRTPFGDTDLFVVNNLVQQGTVLSPILNNCSLDQICKEGKGYQNGNIQLKPLEFVDDIADPYDGYCQAQQSNHVINSILECKNLIFATEKCKVLKFGITKSHSTGYWQSNQSSDILQHS